MILPSIYYFNSSVHVSYSKCETPQRDLLSWTPLSNTDFEETLILRSLRPFSFLLRVFLNSLTDIEGIFVTSQVDPDLYLTP